MEKSQQAFRTISEVSEELGVPQHVLRFWETKFTSVRPMKRAGGRRYYRPEDMDLLVRIRDLLYKDGLTIKGVQKLIKDHGLKTVVSGGADAASIVEGPASIPSARSSADAVDPAAAHSKSINTDSLRHIRGRLVSIRNEARRHAS